MLKHKRLETALALALVSITSQARAGTLLVGPGKTFAAPCAASAAAQDGDLILIDAGLYSGDVCAWGASNLTIRGVGGRAHLDAAGQSSGGKAIWVIQGSNTTVENIEFSGAAVVDMNGAGIRQEGSGLTLRNCYFHDNEDGILTGGGATSDILIESSIFDHNGAGDGFSHNMYIGNVRSFTLRFSWSHDARVGHTVKSRAQKNVILYNRITEENGGDSSYEIDLPNGGDSYIIGNLIQQGPNTGNPTIVTSGEEGASNPVQSLYVINNTIVNDRGSGTFINNATGSNAVLTNNLFIGGGTAVNGAATQMANLATSATILVDRAGFDYHLLPSAATAIDQGVDPGSAGAMVLAPDSQYLHTAGGESRMVVGAAIDLGAFELGNVGGTDGGMPPPDSGVSRDAGSPRDAGAPPPRDAGPGRDAAPRTDTGGGNADAIADTDSGVAEPDAGDLLDAGGAAPDGGASGTDAGGHATDGGLGLSGTGQQPGLAATGGCGCNAAPGAPSSSLLLLGLGFLALLVRRRTT